jgi:L-asparaginase
MMVDSLDMTDQDREVLVKNISSAKEKNIVITHGTDTMVETAKYINKRAIDKTVVITGTLIP